MTPMLETELAVLRQQWTEIINRLDEIQERVRELTAEIAGDRDHPGLRAQVRELGESQLGRSRFWWIVATHATSIGLGLTLSFIINLVKHLLAGG